MGGLLGLLDSSMVPARGGGGPWWGMGGALPFVCDLLTFAGCVAVLLVAVYFVRRRRDASLPWGVWFICAFIFSLSVVHLIGAFHFPGPVYGVWAVFKVAVVLTLWGTVLTLAPLMGRALTVQEATRLSERQREEIDQRRRRQRVLAEANRRLKNNNRDLKRFASVISHDLLEPLRTIHGYASLLGSERVAGTDQDTDHAIARIDASAQRLEDMIKGLMRVTRLGLDEGPRELVDVNDLLREVVGDLHQLLERHGATVEYRGLPKIPVNRVLVRQVFQNLITNAVTYRSDASPYIRIAAVREDGGWRFAVADNGVGIPEQSCKRVFDAFRRLRHRTDSDNLGLGLSIVQTAVEWHGGEVWVESKEGEGSTFYFTLPTEKGPGVRHEEELGRAEPAQLVK